MPPGAAGVSRTHIEAGGLGLPVQLPFRTPAPGSTLIAMSASIQTTKHVFALDCPDAAALGAFYARLLGWRTRSSEDDPGWVSVVPPAGSENGSEIACQQIEGYRSPDWPTGPVPQQAHLDFYVESIAEAAPLAEAAGATKHPAQPSEDGSFMVFLDPAGHPFCLCEN